MTISSRTKVKPPSSISVTYSVVSQGVFVAKIGWTPISSAWPTFYYVLYKDENEFTTSLTGTTYRDSLVVEGGASSYRVSVVNVHEVESDVTPPVSVVIPVYPVWETGWSLSIDQNTTASVAGRASDPNGDPLTFTKEGGTAPAQVTVSSAGVVSVGAAAGGTYTLILRASNGSLNSSYTASITVSVPIVAPGTPTYAAPTVVSSSRIDHSWAAGSGATPTSYELDRSLTGSGGWTNVFTGLAVSYSNTGLSASTQYFYRLRAIAGSTPSSYATRNATTSAASTTRHLFAAATFETGGLSNVPTTYASTNRLNSGLYISTVSKVMNASTFGPVMETGSAGNENFGVNSPWDVHVQDSETVTGAGPGSGSPFTDVVTPRSGSYFLRNEIYRGAGSPTGAEPNYTGTKKHYDAINGFTSGHDGSAGSASKCKPRCAFGFQTQPQVYGMEWDTEIWLGFSLYIPRSFENETYRSGTGGNGPALMESFVTGDTDTTPFGFNLICPYGGENFRLPTTDSSIGGPVAATTDTYFTIEFCTNATGTLENTSTVRKIAVSPFGTGTGGSVDRGRWTDWVFKFCLNPFTSATTNNGISFRANTGGMTIWKSSGVPDANGNRAISEASPIFRYQGSFGLRNASSALSGRPMLNFRSYCYGFRASNPTSLIHSRWFGIDDMRWGYGEDRPGRNMVTNYQTGPTGFDDVCPRSP